MRCLTICKMTLRVSRRVAVVLALVLPPLVSAQPAPAQTPPGPRLIDDFEADEAGAVPSRWRRLEGRDVVPLDPEVREAGEWYTVVREGGRKFLRMRTENESARVVMPNGMGMDWDLATHPQLAWRWRVNEIPPGAREDRRNDTAGAVYVTFSSDWLGRPRSIKYTYSSTLPVGTVVSQGRLKVVVVGSARQGEEGWARVVRDVAADYARLFGSDPPERPISIALWSDSDTTKSAAEVDFDDLMVLPRAE